MVTIKKMKKGQLIQLIEETIANINSVDSFIKDVESKKGKLDPLYNNLINEDDGIIKKINNLKKRAEENLDKILEYHNKLFFGEDEENNSINTQIEDLLNYYTESEEKINKFRKDIFGYKIKDENGEEKEVIGLKKKIEIFYSQQQEKYNELFNQIEEELKGGATTVNLTKAFADKVTEYQKNSTFWSITLVILLLVMSIYYGFLTWNISDVKTLSEAFKNIVFRAPFLAFVVWLGIFLANRRAESKKLEESYKHKEVMARSFVGYKKMLENLDEDDNDKKLLKEHMGNLLKAISIDSGSFLSPKGEEYPLSSFFGFKNNSKEKAIETINQDIV